MENKNTNKRNTEIEIILRNDDALKMTAWFKKYKQIDSLEDFSQSSKSAILTRNLLVADIDVVLIDGCYKNGLQVNLMSAIFYYDAYKCFGVLCKIIDKNNLDKKQIFVDYSSLVLPSLLTPTKNLDEFVNIADSARVSVLEKIARKSEIIGSKFLKLDCGLIKKVLFDGETQEKKINCAAEKISWMSAEKSEIIMMLIEADFITLNEAKELMERILRRFDKKSEEDLLSYNKPFSFAPNTLNRVEAKILKQGSDAMKIKSWKSL